MKAFTSADFPKLNVGPSKPSGSCVATTARPPSVQCCATSSATSALPAVSSEASGSSSSHSGRADKRKPRQRETALLSGRKILRGKIAQTRKPDALQRLVDARGASVVTRVKAQRFERRQLRFGAVLMAEPADEFRALLAACERRRRSCARGSCPRAARESLRSARSSEVLPEPFGPSSCSASPARTRKSEIAEQHALAAPQRQRFDVETGKSCHGPPRQ